MPETAYDTENLLMPETTFQTNIITFCTVMCMYTLEVVNKYKMNPSELSVNDTSVVFQ